MKRSNPIDRVTPELLHKLGQIAGEVRRGVRSGGHCIDRPRLEDLLRDPHVNSWLNLMEELDLMFPDKRSRSEENLGEEIPF